MNEQMHKSIISLPLALLYSAQFLFSESVSSGRRSVKEGRYSGKGLKGVAISSLPLRAMAAVGGVDGPCEGQRLFHCQRV